VSSAEGTRIDVREQGAQGRTADRRLFMQLQVFSACGDAKPLVRALEASRIEAVLYQDVNDPRGVGVLAMAEDPAAFVREIRERGQELLRADVAEQLAHNHGSAYEDVLRLVRQTPTLGETIGSSKTLKAEVVFAVREEMAQSLADCLFRRTDLATTGHPGDEAIGVCATVVASELRWSPSRAQAELADVRACLARRLARPL